MLRFCLLMLVKRWSSAISLPDLWFFDHLLVQSPSLEGLFFGFQQRPRWHFSANALLLSWAYCLVSSSRNASRWQLELTQQALKGPGQLVDFALTDTSKDDDGADAPNVLRIIRRMQPDREKQSRLYRY